MKKKSNTNNKNISEYKNLVFIIVSVIGCLLLLFIGLNIPKKDEVNKIEDTKTQIENEEKISSTNTNEDKDKDQNEDTSENINKDNNTSENNEEKVSSENVNKDESIDLNKPIKNETIKNETNKVEDTGTKVENVEITIPSADVSKDKLIKFINTEKYFGTKNVKLTDVKDTKFLKENKMEKFVDYGFILESDKNEDFERVIILHSDTDPTTVFDLLVPYYLDIKNNGNTTHKKSEQSDKNIENLKLGEKGKYVYIIACKNANQLESDLLKLLKF